MSSDDRHPVQYLLVPLRCLAVVAAIALVGCTDSDPGPDRQPLLGSTAPAAVFPAMSRTRLLARCDSNIWGSCVTQDNGVGELYTVGIGQAGINYGRLDSDLSAVYLCDRAQLGNCRVVARLPVSTIVREVVEGNNELFVSVDNGLNGDIYRCDPTVLGSCVLLFKTGATVLSMAYGEGRIYLGIFTGGKSGKIQSCPADGASSCSTHAESAGSVTALLVANGRLYAGIEDYQGTLWSCSLTLAGNCTVLAKLGDNRGYNRLSYTDGRIQVGLQVVHYRDCLFCDTSIFVLTCDPNLSDRCTTVYDTYRDAPDDKNEKSASSPLDIQIAGGRLFFTHVIYGKYRFYACDPAVAGSCLIFQTL